MELNTLKINSMCSKNFLIKFLVMLWVSFFLFNIQEASAQEVITYKGDTVIVITPKQLITINSVMADYEQLLKQTKAYKDLIKQQEEKSLELLKITELQEEKCRIEREILEKQIKDAELALKKCKKSKTLITTVLGSTTLAGILGLLLVL